MAEPTVAVIIPTFNRSAYLKQAIESVMRQTRPPDELIIIDDGSTDDTAKICSDYSRARYIYQENHGRSCACNHAVNQTDCKYIAFLDDDDLLERSAVGLQLSILREHTECSAVYGRTVRINSAGMIVGEDLVRHRMPRNMRTSLFHENFIRIQTVLVRRQDIVEMGGFDTALWPCDDYDLWLRMVLAGKRFLYIPHILARYRVHQGSASMNNERMARAIVAVVEQNANKIGQSVTANAHYRLGRTLMESGNLTEAVGELRTAVCRRPTSLRYRLYAMLAAHPMFIGSGLRILQRGKRSGLRGLERVGLTEKRWGG